MFVSLSLGSCVVEVSSLTPIKHSAGFVSASRFHSSVGVKVSGMSPELHDGHVRSRATCNTTVRCDGFTLHFSTPTEQSAVEVIVLQRSSAIRSVFGLMSRPRKRVLLCSSPSRKSAVATGPILHVVGPCACRQRWHRHPDRVPLIWLGLMCQRPLATMSCDSMELPFLCEAQPDLRSGQSFRRPPPRRGSTRSAAASPLPLPLACEERRGASDHCGRRSRAQLHRFRRKERIVRWGAISCGGPLGLGGDMYQFPLCTHPDLDNDCNRVHSMVLSV